MNTDVAVFAVAYAPSVYGFATMRLPANETLQPSFNGDFQSRETKSIFDQLSLIALIYAHFN
jgi:hypothetical protein